MWGSSDLGNSAEERVRNYLTDMKNHSINVHMGMASGSSRPFMQSKAEFDFTESLGMRRMETWVHNTRNPIYYFLLDEPDAQDFGVDAIGDPLKRLGALGQGLISKRRELRSKDHATPQMLNVNSTYSPENWYMYSQLADVYCSDPYYTGVLYSIFKVAPSKLRNHTKPTFVRAVTEICHGSCAPKPLHIILQAVRHNDEECPMRYPTPEEKRIEAYYAIGEGAKGLSYWWYTPLADLCDGCGDPEDPEAVALYREIAVLGAELRTAGSLIVNSCPVDLQVTPPDMLSCRCLLVGLDTVIFIFTNEQIVCDRQGTVSIMTDGTEASAILPEDLIVKDLFVVNRYGAHPLLWDQNESLLRIGVGRVQLTRMIVATSDETMRPRLQKLYETNFKQNLE